MKSTPVEPKQPKRWYKRWLWALLFVLFVPAVYAGYLYWQLKSITLDQVLQRQKVMQQQDNKEAGNQVVPPLLDDPLSKANELSNKPINKQDAMDAASILVHSGLSMREMYFLLGQSSEKLTVSEKQRIRDLLNAKLSKEETEALRTITKQYGHGLNIIDPNFPIELVGVYDETERKKIMQELEERKKQQAASAVSTASETQVGRIHSSEDQGSKEKAQAPGNSSIVSSQEKVNPEAVNNQQIENNTGSGHNAAEAAPIKPSSSKGDIEAKYKAQLQSLKGQCEAQVNSIVGEIAAYMSNNNSNDGSFFNGLKTKYLSRISAAEASCDKQAGSIIQKAKAELRVAGLDDSGPDGWQQEYEAAKGAAQGRALSQLEKQLPK